MKLLKYAVIGFLLGAIAAPAYAQDSAVPSAADTYKTTCLMCHGADGTASTPAGKAFKAASFKDPMVTTKSNEELVAIVKSGKDKMPSFKDKLTDAQISALIAYVRKLSNQ